MEHLRDLHPDPENRRKHTPRNVGMIVDALQQVGAGRSIVIDEGNVVLAGNATIDAAAEAGITKVKVVEADGNTIIAVRRRGLTPEQKRKLALYDNRAADLAEWNVDQIKADIAEGLDLSAFFGKDELAEILAAQGEPKAGKTDPDDVPAPRATDIKPGDLFELGKHRLLCGDSTKTEDVARVMCAALGDVLVTSPPYNQKIDGFRPSGMHREGGWVAKVGRLAYADSLPEKEYQDQQAAALSVWSVALRDGASIFYNHKNRYREKEVVSPLSWILRGPFKLRQEIIWSRPGSVTQNARMFLPSDERIYWLYKGDDFSFDDSTEIKSWSTVWAVALEANQTHAVGFPVELPERCIRACAPEGGVVVEPYAGSGTTLVASERLGRACRAVEREPVFCQVIVDRWEKFTGQKAHKAGDMAPRLRKRAS